MPPTRPPYPPQFKEEAVRLMRSSEKPLARISRELGVSEQTLRNWRKQREIDEGEREGLSTDEREELGRLRRKVKVLEQEKEILRKATAFFAREDGIRRASFGSSTRRRPCTRSRCCAGFWASPARATTPGVVGHLRADRWRTPPSSSGSARSMRAVVGHTAILACMLNCAPWALSAAGGGLLG